MAEFCLDCLNKMEGTQRTEEDYVLSKGLELCEGCGEYRRVVIRRRDPRWGMLKWPFRGRRD